MIHAIHADLRRLLTLRSTWVYLVLLTGACYGPIVLLILLYDPAHGGALDAGDLGYCAIIFHMVAIVFAGASAAGEIRNGSVGISFLTQRHRWTSLVSAALVGGAFLVTSYVLGMALAITAGQVYPDGMVIGSKGWAFLAAELGVILVWALAAAAIAVLTRSMATALAVPIVWMLVLENLIGLVPAFRSIMPWMPFTAGNSMTGRILGSGDADPWKGVIVLSAMAVVGSTVALAAHSRRDIPG